MIHHWKALKYPTFRICNKNCKFAKITFFLLNQIQFYSKNVQKMIKYTFFKNPWALTMQFQICKNLCKILNNLSPNLTNLSPSSNRIKYVHLWSDTSNDLKCQITLHWVGKIWDLKNLNLWQKLNSCKFCKF